MWVCEKTSLKMKVLSWVLYLARVGRFCRLAGSEFQTEGAVKVNKHSAKDFKLCFKFSKASHLRIGGYVMFDIYIYIYIYICVCVKSKAKT